MLDRMQSLKASEVMPRDAEWFIDGHIALGDVTLVAAPKGVGKSQFAAHLAACATSDKPFSAEGARRVGPPRNVLLFSAERHLGATIRPRLEAAGADLDRVRVCGNSTVWDIRGITAEIRRASMEGEDIGLVIIDPIDSYEMPGTSRKARRVLETLFREAQDCRATIVLIQNTLMKLRPTKGMPASAAIRGTSTLVDFCVSTWMIEPIPTGGALIECMESNLSNKGVRYSFSIEGATVGETRTSRLVMHGPAEQSIQEVRLNPNHSNGPKRNGIGFLVSRMAYGVHLRALPLLQEAQTNGLTPKDIETACQYLKIEKREVPASEAGAPAGWEWLLPPPRQFPCFTRSVEPVTSA